MGKNNASASKNAPAPADAKGASMLRLVVLGLAVGLVAVGAIIVFRPPAVNPANKPAPVTEGQRAIEQAQSLMAEGLHKPAIELLMDYLRSAPDDADAYLLLAQALWEFGEYASAERVVDGLWESLPNKARLWWLKGELVRRRETNPARYMTFFQKATDCPDVTPEQWSRYGQLLVESDPREARRWCQRAYDAGWRDASTLRVLGTLALDNNELSLARDLLETAVEKEKNNPEIWLPLVQTYRELGQADRAVETAQMALQGRPNGELWLELGQLLEERGEKERAAAAFAEAADYRLVQAEASVAAARLYYDLGQFARAMRYIDQARAIATLHDDPVVVVLLKQIEDARFGPQK